MKTDTIPVTYADDRCTRCGQAGHRASQCKQSIIEDEDEEASWLWTVGAVFVIAYFRVRQALANLWGPR